MSRTWRRGKKEHLFYRTSPIGWFCHYCLFSFTTKKGRHAFEEENEISQRNIEENSNNIVENQEQVAVSSTASLVKISTSSCSSGTSWILIKNSSIGIREWTHNEFIELTAIWKEKEALYKTSVCSFKQEINSDTKQYWFLSIMNYQFR